MKAYFWMTALAVLIVAQLAVLKPIIEAVLQRNYFLLGALAAVYLLAANTVLDKVLAQWGEEELD